MGKFEDLIKNSLSENDKQKLNDYVNFNYDQYAKNEFDKIKSLENLTPENKDLIEQMAMSSPAMGITRSIQKTPKLINFLMKKFGSDEIKASIKAMENAQNLEKTENQIAEWAKQKGLPYRENYGTPALEKSNLTKDFKPGITNKEEYSKWRAEQALDDRASDIKQAHQQEMLQNQQEISKKQQEYLSSPERLNKELEILQENKRANPGDETNPGILMDDYNKLKTLFKGNK